MYSYEGLKALLASKGIAKTELTTALGISSRTIAKIAKGEKLSNMTLRRIAEYLDCDPAMLYREISGNPILQLLRSQCLSVVPEDLFHHFLKKKPALMFASVTHIRKGSSTPPESGFPCVCT